MKESELNKQQFANFGRTFALVFNRSFMYNTKHPFQVEAVDKAYQTLAQLLQTNSPVVFILNREQFYVDEEPLDPRLSVSRIVTHFKKTGIESVSFYKGVVKKDLRLFLEIATSLDKYPDAAAMGKAMFKKRINRVKINHVFYRKVSAEDEVIARDVLDKVTPEMTDEHQDKMKQMFMNSVFNSVLQEDFIKNLNLQNLLKNPGDLSKEMIAVDLKSVKQYENERQQHENKSQQYANEGQQSGNEGPQHGNKGPQHGNEGPATRKRRTATRKQRTATRKRRTATRKQRTATRKQRTATRKRRTATRKPRPATRKRRTATRKQRTATRKPRTATRKQRTAIRKQRTATRKRRTATRKQRTATRKRRTATRKPRPATRKPRPATRKPRPAKRKRRTAIRKRRTAPRAVPAPPAGSD